MWSHLFSIVFSISSICSSVSNSLCLLLLISGYLYRLTFMDHLNQLKLTPRSTSLINSFKEMKLVLCETFVEK